VSLGLLPDISLVEDFRKGNVIIRTRNVILHKFKWEPEFFRQGYAVSGSLGAPTFTWLSSLVALGLFFANVGLCAGLGMWPETQELWDRKKNSCLVPASALSVGQALSVAWSRPKCTSASVSLNSSNFGRRSVGGGGGWWGRMKGWWRGVILPPSCRETSQVPSSLLWAEERKAEPSVSPAAWTAVLSHSSQLCLNHKHFGGEIRGWMQTKAGFFFLMF